MSIEIAPEDEPSHPSLAVGTADANREGHTKIDSPGARAQPSRPQSKPPPRPRTSDDPDIRIGSVLGTYRLAELLGKGGMGYVYRAEHTKLGREVALKLLRADYARRRDAVERFRQEAKTVNRVRHRNIVDVTDIVDLDDGTTFIIMEMLRGTSLGKWARSGVDLPRALAVLVQICDGLSAAHAVGVVHRDLKPDNVIVVPTSDGGELVKLLDFGVAKLVNRDDEDVGFQTAAGSVIGTPAYMSPEQAGGMAVDHRSDIYSLGAIMYELFCGQPMFRGRSFGEFVRKHLTELPVPPRQTEAGAGIDERLESLILCCLAKDPNERFGHILELRDGLLHMLGGGIDTHPPGYASVAPSGIRPMPTTQLPPHMLPLAPNMATTVPTPPHPSSVSMASQQMYTQYTQPPPAASPWWVWMAGGAFAIGLGIVGAVWYANRTAPEPDVKPTPAHDKPTAAPIEPVPNAPAQQVELRFDSLPSGGVYADGHAAELCRTPCAFNVDLNDGGGAERRTFVVRSDGYRDKPVVVELAGAQHEFHVTLDHLEPAVPIAQPVQPTSDPGEIKPVKHPIAKTTKTTKTTKLGDKKPTDKPVNPKLNDDRLEPLEPVADTGKPTDKKPTDKKPVTKKPDEKIDPADTHDPFHRHQ